MTEIHDLDALDRWLDSGASLTGVRLQGVDLRGYAHVLGQRDDVAGLAVLGGHVPADLAGHLWAHGALVFPDVPDAPVNPYRADLYRPEELYSGLERGYAHTADALAYEWSRRARGRHDALLTSIRALHDDSISDALHEALAGRAVVGVMGGHAVRRGTPDYRDAAELGRLVVASGRSVITGGGPGAMEAVNLGAYLGDDEHGSVMAELAHVPDFTDIDAWAAAAWRVRERTTAQDDAVSSARSLGVPTWFYGHEPPNVFCHRIAKYFSNAVREDALIRASTAGVIVLPGSAGTVQEIFAAVTPRYYDGGRWPTSALVLVGHDHWTDTVPLWPVLVSLAKGKDFSSRLFLVDSVADAVERLGS